MKAPHVVAEDLAIEVRSLQTFLRLMYEHHLDTPPDTEGRHATLEAMFKALAPWVAQQADALEGLASTLQAEVTR